MSRRTAPPPSGTPAPVQVGAPGGGMVDVRLLAEAVCVRYRDEFPDERERYGDAGPAWCAHDNQYILAWALTDAGGVPVLDEQIGWLARVLDARSFPLDRLVRDLEIAAAVVGETGEPWSEDVAARLLAARGAVG